jgi:long-chain fatty acid transport protein
MKKLLLMLVALSPSLVKAQAFSSGFFGNKQHGMGNAGLGLALDPASNPAASFFFKDGKTNAIAAGAAVAKSSIAYLDSTNFSQNKTNNPIGTPFYLYAVWGVNDSTGSMLSRFKFLLTVTTPYGASVNWADDWTGRNVVLKKSVRSVLVTPGVAYKISDKLSVAAGVGFASSRLKVENGIPVSSDAKVNLDFKQRGIGFGGSIFYKASDELSFALVYVSQVNNKSYEGTATFNVPSSLSPLFPNGSVSTGSSTPNIISFGTGYRPTDKLTFAFDVNYQRWSCFDTTVFDFAVNTSALADSKTPNVYKDVVSLRFGAQYEVMDGLFLRAGTSFEPTPVPEKYVHPDAPDSDRINLTCGIGYRIGENFMVDASYRFVNPKKRIAQNDFHQMYGVYKTYGHVIGLGVSYIF